MKYNEPSKKEKAKEKELEGKAELPFDESELEILAEFYYTDAFKIIKKAIQMGMSVSRSVAILIDDTPSNTMSRLAFERGKFFALKSLLKVIASARANQDKKDKEKDSKVK